MSITSLYLAGPDVFFPGAMDIGLRKKALCRQYGFEGLFPLDNLIQEQDSAQAMSTAIYQSNVGLMQQADAILANITPFRGPNMDPGTAFEIGYFAALGKPVFLYSNDPRTYRERIPGAGDFDELGHTIEDFGDIENLMIIRAASLLPIPSMPVPAQEYYTSLQNFEAALGLIRQF